MKFWVEAEENEEVFLVSFISKISNTLTGYTPPVQVHQIQPVQIQVLLLATKKQCMVIISSNNLGGSKIKL